MGDPGIRHRLAAILAADAAGYTRLMSTDETATVALLDTARAVFRTRVESHRGRIVDMAGDSVLAVFETAVGAVTAALDIQKELTSMDTGTPQVRRMLFRIGVHLGDVIEKPDGTVYGDGVNIAARLQAVAEPGGVSISDAVYGAARDRLPGTFEDQGEHHVKNVARPVHAFRLSAEPEHGGSKGLPRQEPAPKPSVAVLPFDNLSGDPSQDYFADGITEDTIAALSKNRWPGASTKKPWPNAGRR
jgi:adenylate cyclase